MRRESTVSIPDIDRDAAPLFEVPNMTGTPERNLLLAILERAVLDYVGNESEWLEDADNWIFSDEDDASDFSFTWVCHQLDLNSLKIRDKIRNMPKRGHRRIAPWYFMSA